MRQNPNFLKKASSRLHSATSQNLAAVIAMRTNVERMNEILEHPVQQGENTLTNNRFDIVFEHVGFSYNDGETVLKDVSFTTKQGEVTGLSVPPAA